MSPPGFELAQLAKSYNRRRVLNGITLTGERGEVVALLGPNGAGKTTTVRILATLIGADSGTARVAGFDVRTQAKDVRRRISLTGQFTALDDQLTAEENLVLIGRLAGLPHSLAHGRANDLLHEFHLAELRRQRLRSCSGGQRRRVDLAAGLITKPELLILDEPTVGLDPRSRLETWDQIAAMAASGVTVLLTTQQLEEADRLAHRVAVLDGGDVVAEGTVEQLKERVAENRLEIKLRNQSDYDQLRTRLGPQILAAEPAERLISLATDGSAVQVRTLLNVVDPDADLIETFAIRTATLDDVFLALTGHASGGAGTPGTGTTGTDPESRAA